MRMMVIFEKGAELRFIGHLDLMRTMQRALRRSDLPIKYSNGFNPHIRLSFAAPLSVGVVGLRELMEVPVEDGLSEEAFESAMNKVLPSCVRIRRCRAVDDTFPTLMSLTAGSRYTIRFDKGEESTKAVSRIVEFVALPSYEAIRRTKSGENACNISQFVLSASVSESEDGYAVDLTTICTDAGSLKPSLWLKSLCEFASVKPFPAIIYRDAVLSRLADGTLIPMEDWHA